MEDLLPANTLVYLASTNLAEVVHRFQLLDAYKTAQARLPKEELEAGDNPLSIVTRFLSFGISDSRALEDTRIGVALIVPEALEETEEQKKAKAADPNFRQPMPDPLLLVFVEGARMEEARQAREQFLAYYNESFRAIGKLSEIKQSDYKGAKVDRFKTGDIGMWFGATYVLSQPDAMDRLLQLRADRRAERLADDQEFTRVRAQMMPQTGLFAYLNGKPLGNLLKGVFGGGSRGGFGPADMFLSALSWVNNIKSAALSSTFEREGVVDRLQLNLDTTKENMLAPYFGPKIEYKALPYIPAGTQVLVSHSFDWVKIYDEALVKGLYGSTASQELMRQYTAEYEAKRKEAEDKKQKPPEMDWNELQQRMKAELTEEKIRQRAKARETEVNEELGFVLREEAVKDLANEVTFAYGIPKFGPVAEKDGEELKKKGEGWAVFVGIKDRAATQQALLNAFAYFSYGMMNPDKEGTDNTPPKTEEQRKQLREARNKNLQAAWAMMPSEIYKKVEIKSVFAAYLGFTEDFLIVADSKETIKQVIDVADGGRAMAADFNYSRAMNSLSGAGGLKIFVGPQWFDDTLQGFVESWVANPSALESASRVPLNVPATAAAALENDNGNLKLELYSPLGIAGTIALWSFGSDVKKATETNENAARQQLWELRKAQKVYAQKHNNLYATLETLAKAKLTAFDVEKFKQEEGNYKFAFKLKPNHRGYEASATPIKYGRLGRKSFFLDETDKLHAADKQGATATASDEMVEERVFGEEDTTEEGGTPRRAIRRKQ